MCRAPLGGKLRKKLDARRERRVWLLRKNGEPLVEIGFHCGRLELATLASLDHEIAQFVLQFANVDAGVPEQPDALGIRNCCTVFDDGEARSAALRVGEELPAVLDAKARW